MTFCVGDFLCWWRLVRWCFVVVTFCKATFGGGTVNYIYTLSCFHYLCQYHITVFSPHNTTWYMLVCTVVATLKKYDTSMRNYHQILSRTSLVLLRLKVRENCLNSNEGRCSFCLAMKNMHMTDYLSMWFVHMERIIAFSTSYRMSGSVSYHYICVNYLSIVKYCWRISQIDNPRTLILLTYSTYTV